jgi:coenzyme F420 biosynthesis associated uncharacterized protein
MTDTLRLVDWELATTTAIRLAPRGPSVTRSDAFNAVRHLRQLAIEAEDHVAAFTGMAAGHAHEPANVVERSGWIEGNVGGFQVVMAPLLEKLAAKQAGKFGAPLVTAVGSRVAGMQIGLLLAFLSGKILGQYELFLPPDEGRTPEGRLTLVAPNIVAAERQLGADPRDFRLWVCVHEVTHRTQFTAVPWLREHVRSEIGAFLAASDLDSAELLRRLRAVGDAIRDNARHRGTPAGSSDGARDGGRAHTAPADLPTLLEAVQTPEQRAILHRLTAVMTLLEGHGEYVMNGVGPSVIPSVDEISRKFHERRRGQNPADRLVRKLFGLDMKAKQYAEGAAFVRTVVEEVGMASFNRVWTSPNTLPNRAEIADPAMWMKRVLRTSKNSGPAGDPAAETDSGPATD